MNFNLLKIAAGMLLAFLIPSISIAATHPVININYSQQYLQNLSDPQSFSTQLFALITADAEQSSANSQIYHAFFTPELLSQYEKVAALDAKSNEVGCLNDFNNFTGAQDNSSGFWVGRATTKGTSFFVPIYLNFNNALDLKKPDVILQLVKTSSGFKIEDIQYTGSGKDSLRSIIQGCLAQSKK